MPGERAEKKGVAFSFKCNFAGTPLKESSEYSSFEELLYGSNPFRDASVTMQGRASTTI